MLLARERCRWRWVPLFVGLLERTRDRRMDGIEFCIFLRFRFYGRSVSCFFRSENSNELNSFFVSCPLFGYINTYFCFVFSIFYFLLLFSLIGVSFFLIFSLVIFFSRCLVLPFFSLLLLSSSVSPTYSLIFGSFCFVLGFLSRLFSLSLFLVFFVLLCFVFVSSFFAGRS